ncbi:MAG TPA: START-like domain-containing protein [Bacteroidia bacterium]|jgi:uncharacterized protein YndB with AHSA1/START domain|nr:START-like domain-containing protein [Bacteroidia bacterium]
MSKKTKGSSAKGKKKNTAKTSKKKTSKKTKPVAKKKPVKKVLKKKVKPVKKIKAKKPAKKIKPVKVAKAIAPAKVQKSIVKGSIKEYQRPIHDIKNPVLLKKDSEPIPEFKPTIQPTVKLSDKDSIPTTLKTTTSGSFVSTPIKKTDSYSVKPEKEPPGKFEIEIVIRASAELLYEFLVSPSGLSEWFCDDVNIRNGIYTFVWDGQLQQARLLKTVEEQLVRYQWVDKTDGSYFEFKIQRDDLTNDISLIITDFASDKTEQESAKLLWQSQIDKLLHLMGSYF